MSMMCKINKSEILGGPLSFFDALFGRCTTFYGHFLVDFVTSEGSTHISSSDKTLDAGLRTLDSGCSTLGAGPWTLDLGRWILHSGCCTLNTRL